MINCLFHLKLPNERHTKVLLSAAPPGTTVTQSPGGGGQPHMM